MAWPGGKPFYDGVDFALELAPTNAWNAAPTFVDITANLQSFSYTYGRSSSILEQPTAGSFTATLVDNTRTFDPEYASSPYFSGGLDPGRQLRLRARYATVEYTLGYWYVDNWRQIGEPSNHLGMVELTAVDGFDMLSRARSPINTVINVEGGGERVDQRIGRYLDFASFPAALRIFDTDCPTVGALDRTTEHQILSSIQQTAASDFGLFFMGPDGSATYRGHRWQLGHNLTAAATLGDAAGEFGYTTSVRDFGAAQILNHIKGSAFTPLLPRYTNNFSTTPYVQEDVEVSDAASIAARGERIRDLGVVEILNSNVLLGTLEAALARYKDPLTRTPTVTLRPRVPGSVGIATQMPVLLAAHMGTRFTLNRRPQNVGSASTVQTVVEGGGMNVSVDGTMEVNYWLSETSGGAGASGYWVLGTSKLGSSGTAVMA